MQYSIGNSCKIEINERVLNIDIQIYNIYSNFCIQLSTSICSIQLCECSHVEAELSCMLCKLTHCIVHLENIEMKIVKVTVVLRLQ